MLCSKNLALAGVALMLMGLTPAASLAEAPGQEPPVASAGETRDAEILQFLQQVAWARDALEQDLHGQGAEALDNARLLLEDARETQRGVELGGVALLLAEADDAVGRGHYAWAIEQLARIEEVLGATMEERVGTDRPQPQHDP